MNCCNANGQCTGGTDCPVRPGQEMPTPVHAPARQHMPCDQLGVCNCSGQHCEFELPDLGPMSTGEAILYCVLLLLSAGSAVGILKWVVDNFGARISTTATEWGRFAIQLLRTAVTLYS
jgi:hypothetical protein